MTANPVILVGGYLFLISFGLAVCAIYFPSPWNMWAFALYLAGISGVGIVVMWSLPEVKR
jgi:hypothetical protein